MGSIGQDLREVPFQEVGDSFEGKMHLCIKGEKNARYL